ncbi:MAG: bifunctional glutamate N-acetyltransferase/amino-acid acetyltransferase ArgJ [Oscillospiraceae bacterium]|jgi:glutamate N-acetyltransferase/amino-acid N-acetyltransferase|nr:bifunctional glutamate N-acetyltransferase/amino-acid acetyltransferase ArgJ [Oscillospiraceae bacterium]
MAITGVCTPKGFRAAGLHCGIRKNQTKKDLALVLADAPCAAAAVYTQNKVYGAPITVTRAHLANGVAQAMLCNSGNANTCNADGVEKAETLCDMLARAAGIDAGDVIIASTGVIGQPLTLDPIQAAMPSLVAAASAQGGEDAAQAIMTTDRAIKQASAVCTVDGVPVTLGAMAKGSGMIAPNMATLLCFITTDAAITPPMLQKALTEAVADTFNMLIVDGDTSTNDMVSALASGLAGNPVIDRDGPALAAFTQAMRGMAEGLTRAMAKDGEGATKLVTCHVTGAPDAAIARAVARAVIASPLCKTAMFGADANWGRVLCAIGYAPGDFSVQHVAVDIASAAGRVAVCRSGRGVPFSEEEAKTILNPDEVTWHIDLGLGVAAATAWGCDLSYEYVRINGDYRS